MTKIITENEQLEKSINIIKKSKIIAVDTEFRRCSTYYPQICLIQINDGQNIHIIDVLSKELELEKLHEILKSREYLKIFHDASQDIEVFWHCFGYVPENIFDTQIAADLCSFGANLSYQKIAKILLNENIDKDQQFTNWQNRPLSDRQIKYAGIDVLHLPKIHNILSLELEKKQRQSWNDQLSSELINIDKFENNWQKIFSKLRMIKQDSQSLKIAHDLVKWREEIARKTDVPRMRILTNEKICEISYQKPLSIKELKKLKVDLNDFLHENLEKIIEIVACSLAKNEKDLNLVSRYKMKKTNKFKSKKEEIEMILRNISTELGISTKLICTKDELDNLVVDLICKLDVNAKFTKGWRSEIFKIN